MIRLKTKEEIAILKEGGARLAFIVETLAKALRAGVSTLEIDTLAEHLTRDGGDIPSLKNYKPKGANTPYPATICISINDEVVHGIPKGTRIIKEGDVVGLDMSITHKGLVTDMATTVAVGTVDKKSLDLMRATKEALFAGIEKAKIGNTIGDIGAAIEASIKPHGYGIVRELAGHGVGFGVHEEPMVPNFGKKGKGETLREGMVIAIEPMINEGAAGVRFLSDGYTVITKDGSRSAHFEHTVAIVADGPVILTELG